MNAALFTQRLISGFLVLAIAGTTMAADIREIQVGDRYYLYRLIGNNDLVSVRAVDHQNNRVKIMYQNGGVDWVSPSNLMSKSESETADMVTQGVGWTLAGTALYCLVNPQDCRENQKPAAAAQPEIAITVINDHCRAVDYYQDGSKVIANLAPGERRRFTARPGERQIHVCNAGSNECSKAKPVTWLESRETRVQAADDCAQARRLSAWDARPLIPGSWTTYSGRDADQWRAYLRPRTEARYRDLVDRTRRVRCATLPFYNSVSVCEGEVPNESGDGIVTFIGNDDGVRVLDGNAAVIHDMNARFSLSLDTERKTSAYLRFFNSAIQANDGTFEIVDSANDIGWTVAGPARPTDLPLSSVQLSRAPDRSWRAAATVYTGRDLFRANFRISLNGMVLMTEDTPLRAGLPAATLKYLDGVKYRVQ